MISRRCDVPFAGASSKATVTWFPAVVLSLIMLGAGGSLLWAESPKQAIDLALSNDATVKSAASAVTAAQLDAASTARTVLPSLNLGASYQYNTASADLTLPIPGHTQTISLVQHNTIDTSAGIRWTPFTGFARQASIELKRLAALLAENSLDSTQVQVALKTVIAYRQAQAAQLQIDTLTSGKQRVQLQLDQTTTLEEQGMAKKVDVLSLTISRLDYDQKLIAAKASLADALEQLNSLTGKAITVAPAPTEAVDITLPPLKIGALDQMKALAIQRDVIAAKKKLAESKYYPTIGLSGSLHYGLPGVDPAQNEWMLYGVAGVSLSWSYDWGSTALAVRAAQSKLTKLSSDEAAARDQISLEYAKAVRDWHALSEEANVLKATLDLARTKMNIVKSQYEQGMASTTDFNDANLELTQAEIRYRSQLLALLLKANQIDALSGEPIDTWSIAQ